MSPPGVLQRNRSLYRLMQPHCMHTISFQHINALSAFPANPLGFLMMSELETKSVCNMDMQRDIGWVVTWKDNRILFHNFCQASTQIDMIRSDNSEEQIGCEFTGLPPEARKILQRLDVGLFFGGVFEGWSESELDCMITSSSFYRSYYHFARFWLLRKLDTISYTTYEYLKKSMQINTWKMDRYVCSDWCSFSIHGVRRPNEIHYVCFEKFTDYPNGEFDKMYDDLCVWYPRKAIYVYEILRPIQLHSHMLWKRCVHSDNGSCHEHTWRMIRCRTRYDRLAERIIQFGTLVGIKWIHGILQACKYTLFSAQEYEMALRELSFMIKQPEGQVRHLQKMYRTNGYGRIARASWISL